MKVTVIGIAGLSGSGKSTLSNALLAHYGTDLCTVISSDNYYYGLGNVPFENRRTVNFDHPDSTEFKLLANHISQLKLGQPVDIPTYDFAISSRKKEKKTILPKPIIIVEGVLVLHAPELHELFDATIFVKTKTVFCFMRRLERDLAERERTLPDVIIQYKKHVIPMSKQFIKPSIAHANLIVDNNNETSAGLQFELSPIVSFIELVRSGQKLELKRCQLFSKSANPKGFEIETGPSMLSSKL